jgi:hypothetical protein
VVFRRQLGDAPKGSFALFAPVNSDEIEPWIDEPLLTNAGTLEQPAGSRMRRQITADREM